RDDTMVILVSDNGATREGGSLGDVNWYRSANVMPLGSIAEQIGQLDDVGGPNTAPVNATGWSMVGNTPLKRYKGNTHGGGIRDPLIISWPARLVDHGGIRSQFCHIIDVLPTVVALAGVEVPATINGIDQQPIEGVSLAKCVDSPTVASPKGAQYFEMHGNRGIWRDGWKAVTFHVPNTPFDNDRWELYHLDRDVGECHDVAAEHPLLVAELVDAWWQEARKYSVLPLDDRILERFLVSPPNPITDRRRFVYYAGAYVPTEAMPDVRNVSFEIRARLDRAPGSGDGVIAACGDRLMGYAFYIKDGHLRFHYNAAGSHSFVRSSTDLPHGNLSVSFGFEKTGPLRGTGRLFVGGDEIAAATIGPTIGVTFAPLGLSIGMGRASAVANDYDGRFAFQGKLHEVVFVVGDDRGATEIPTYMND
ncbi:MAG: sulfatase/phosphatase domain-containing protein, partial [Acidimicrobiales bacterium]